jgi:uncharacterized membrane protein YedE/YeeE
MGSNLSEDGPPGWLLVLGLSLFGFPFLILWYLGRSTYNTDYVPKIERLHADFYAVK